MVSSAIARLNPRRNSWIAFAIIAAMAAMAAFGGVVLSGTKTGLAIGLTATAGPPLVYLAIVAPVVFPFSAFGFLTPFDSVLNLPAFGTITKIVGGASALAMLFYMLRTKRALQPPRSTALWVVLYLWMTASMFWAIDAQTSQQLLPTALMLFGLYAVASMVRIDFKQLRFFAVAVTLGGLASALYGLYMLHSGGGLFKDRLFVRTDTSSLNPDHFASSLLLPIALCLAAALWSKSLLVKVASVGAIAVMLVTIDLTGARGALLGFGGLMLYLIWRDPHRKALIASGAGLFALAVAITGPMRFIQRWALAGVNGGAGRVSIWHTGWIAFKQNWLVGAGYANFPFAYDRAFISTFQSFYANWHRASHNILLNTAVELGVIGLVLLLLAWWYQFRLLRNVEPTDARFPLKLALEGSLIALFICGMFADIMIEKYVWLAFMLVVLTRNAAVPPRPSSRLEPAANHA